MNKREIEQIQQLLYVWISNFDKRSLESIKQKCDYLNEIYHLELQNPIWGIFWPLVFNGVIDHVGSGFYSLSVPVVLDYSTHFYYINVFPQKVKSEYVAVGITLSEALEEVKCKIMHPSTVSILKTYPCIKDVIDGFPRSLEDEANLKYVNWKAKRGLAELEKEGLTRYFSLPEQQYIRQLPSRVINPEAYALSYCLTRVVCKESNGTYNCSTRQLIMPSFAMPFMIYRVLLLECLASRNFPQKQDSNYIFENISAGTVKQLNRIFCNSIQYE